MRRTGLVARRIVAQLSHDRRLLALSVLAPLLIVYFVRLFVDSAGPGFPTGRYVMPIAAFLVHFLSFLLAAIVLIQERTAGTIERMFINGFTRFNIVGGYVIGYLGLATLQAVVVLTESLLLFEIAYDWSAILGLFVVIWLLAVASVMLGIFVSTFARHEGHVFPFVPLLMVPSVFLSGLLIDVALLPDWAQWVGRALPLYYANDAIQQIINPATAVIDAWPGIAILAGYIVALLLVASTTLRRVG